MTRDLYPILDEAGAIFIDATQYVVGVPPSPALPRAPITVNLNYLARYPILGEDGQPIAVDPAEEAWILAVPATLKPQLAWIGGYYNQWRGRNLGFQSAAEANQAMVGEPSPGRLRPSQLPGHRLWRASPAPRCGWARSSWPSPRSSCCWH
ncbi:MAG: hypothetical protein LBQ06_07830 [Frankiaceae bacterium]|nr:hypothetical protein [Frankiaceae bacterium]